MGDFFKKLWDTIIAPFRPKTPENASIEVIDKYGNSSFDKKNEDSSTSPTQNKSSDNSWKNDYIIEYQKPKTFSEWLDGQGLSNDENSQNYFGNYFKKSAESLEKQAYSDYSANKSNINALANSQGIASHNAYKIASSDFSKNNELLYANGLTNSGFDSYLKGLTYLAYRDEILKNNQNKMENLNLAENKLNSSLNEIETNLYKDIADKESELINLYNQDIRTNKNLL